MEISNINHKVENYRPVSLTTDFVKIILKIIKIWVIYFIINGNQYVFWYISAEDATATLTTAIYDTEDQQILSITFNLSPKCYVVVDKM